MRLINADKLKQDVLSWEDGFNGFSDTYDKARIIDAIDEQPTIEAEPVCRGRWIKWYHRDADYSINCSLCFRPVGWPTPYCPQCGALMEE